METDYGTDADWSGDTVSEYFPWSTGPRVVGLDLSRGLQIPAGSIEYLPNTISLVDYLESNASNETIQAAVERVARSDVRIESETVTVTRDDQGEVTVKVFGLTAEGPFALVMTASEASVTLATVTESAA